MKNFYETTLEFVKHYDATCMDDNPIRIAEEFIKWWRKNDVFFCQYKNELFILVPKRGLMFPTGPRGYNSILILSPTTNVPLAMLTHYPDKKHEVRATLYNQ